MTNPASAKSLSLRPLTGARIETMLSSPHGSSRRFALSRGRGLKPVYHGGTATARHFALSRGRGLKHAQGWRHSLRLYFALSQGRGLKPNRSVEDGD